MKRVVDLFPAGGPIAPDLVIGRAGDIDTLTHMAREGVSTALAGPRRSGKTTVGDAVCTALVDDMMVLERVEVPEHRDGAKELLRGIVAACEKVTLRDEAKKLARALRPTLELLLRGVGLSTDFGDFFADPSSLSQRQVLMLPVALARTAQRPVLLFLDELQRVAAHEDGGLKLLADLVDLYSAQRDVVVLVDGSEERLLDELFDEAQLDKLLRRRELALTIAHVEWRAALPDRFRQAELEIDADSLEKLITFGGGRPFDTMLVCQYAALTASRLGTGTVTEFDVDGAIVAARKDL